MRNSGDAADRGGDRPRSPAELSSAELHRHDGAAAEAFGPEVEIGNQAQDVAEVFDLDGGQVSGDAGLRKPQRNSFPTVQAVADQSLVVADSALHEVRL